MPPLRGAPGVKKGLQWPGNGRWAVAVETIELADRMGTAFHRVLIGMIIAAQALLGGLRATGQCACVRGTPVEVSHAAAAPVEGGCCCKEAAVAPAAPLPAVPRDCDESGWCCMKATGVGLPSQIHEMVWGSVSVVVTFDPAVVALNELPVPGREAIEHPPPGGAPERGAISSIRMLI